MCSERIGKLLRAAVTAGFAACAPLQPLEVRDSEVRILPLSHAPTRLEAQGFGIEVLALLALSASDRRFGGLSGLLVDGDDLLLLSDRATLWRVPCRRLEIGEPAALRLAVTSLRALDGPVDAEDLARDGEGRLLVASESGAGLYVVAGDDGRLAPAAPRALAALATAVPNRGIEAATQLADDRLLVVTEGPIDAEGNVRAAIVAGNRLTPLRFPVTEGFRPVGAETFEDMVLVLERRFSPFVGFSARLGLLSASAIAAGGQLPRPHPLVTLTPPLPGENFEAIAVATGGSCAGRLYLVSDDNFSPLQRTLLVVARILRP